ncbi:MAG: sigma 54-interacting transcriptional regulator [Deltaproteobacteria bacterium]|nr:sigma 54-interacting transcriptional regulator [Deltaproteobacteria bacterium]
MLRRDGATTTEDVRAPSRAGSVVAPPHVFRLIECESPASLPARSCLRGLEEVTFGRTSERSAEVTGRTLALGLPDRFLSTAHARLHRTETGWLLQDLGSKNGTLVGGARIQERLLEDGDLFEVGRTLMLFRASLPSAPSAPVHLEAAALAPQESALLTLDPAHEAALQRLRAVAPSKLSVLVTGESGTGKELAAAALHALSGRTRPLVAVNCAALAPTLLESQLFGHRKGAFSGANDDAPGLVRASDRGTLFLDEIGELPPPAQAALLRVLAEGQVLPVGGTAAVPVDLRVVCATNRDLKAMVAAGTFRGDLLARLQGFVLELVPLRERLADLGLLVSALLRRHAPEPDAVRFEPEAARALARHRWPFNVRELDQTLASALLLAGSHPIALTHLPAELREATVAPPKATLAPEEQELRARLVALFVEHAGNMSAVARVMGKGRTQIVRWVQRFGIDPLRPR